MDIKFSLQDRVCPLCDYILDISRTNPIDIKEDIDLTIEKILDDVPTVQVNTTTLNSIKNSKKYSTLNKKEQNKISDYYEKQKNAYYVCNNCGYSKPIESGAILFTNFIKKKQIQTREIYDNKLKIGDNTLLKTKDYICPNPDCTSIRGVTEATIYKTTDSHNVYYICSACGVSF